MASVPAVRSLLDTRSRRVPSSDHLLVATATKYLQRWSEKGTHSGCRGDCLPPAHHTPSTRYPLWITPPSQNSVSANITSDTLVESSGVLRQLVRAISKIDAIHYTVGVPNVLLEELKPLKPFRIEGSTLPTGEVARVRGLWHPCRTRPRMPDSARACAGPRPCLGHP